MAYTIESCEGCNRLLNREMQCDPHKSKIEDYFCSPACLEKTIQHQIDIGDYGLFNAARQKELAITDIYDECWGKYHKEQREREQRYEKLLAEKRADYKKRMEAIEERVEKEYRRWCKDYDVAALENEEMDAREELLTQKQFDKDYEAGEKEHGKFLEVEAFQEALKPQPLPQHIRYEHTHILGPSGSGKTSLIQQLILDDIRTLDPLPAYVIIDPKGMMVERLSRLQSIKDDIIFIDPTKYPLPALDMFNEPVYRVDEQQRARIRNNLIEAFAYIFSTANAKLTQRQSIPFGYVVRLVFFMGGNIDTLMDILEDNAKERRFYPAMQKLGEQDRGARRFFDTDFYSTGFGETRQQIKTRLYEIISRPELMAMFAAGENRLSMFDCLQKCKIVLVNTAMPQLGSTASQLLGRYFISMTLNAAFARFAIPREHWTPAYLIIDEFQDFADEEMTPRMLRLAREYNLGVVIAHQNMYCAELNDNIRNAISTNTSIKYAASPEGGDLNYMARDMRCEPDFLKTMTKHGNIAKFACYVRGMNLTHPFVYDVELGYIDRWNKMPIDVHNRLMQTQREVFKAEPHQVIQKPQPSQQKPVVEQPPSAPTPEPIASQPPSKTLAPQPTPNTDPDHGEAGEPANKW